MGPLAILLLLISCAAPTKPGLPSSHDLSPTPARSSLPTEVVMNEGAGRGDLLTVMLRIGMDGEEYPFILDTGAPGTLFDRSLESKLTRLPLGIWTVQTLNEKQKSAVYVQPALYLGNVPLVTGKLAATFDMKQLSSAIGRPIRGVLGMDCLRHYCIQLDFEAQRVRFLDPSSPRSAKPGTPFPVTFSFLGEKPSINHPGLMGGTASACEIDTGFNLDGEDDLGTFHAINNGVGRIPSCAWNGDTYDDLLVGNSRSDNRLGLRFLARHLVTLDFPNRTLYLQRRRAGPLRTEQATAEGNAAAQSALNFLRNLLSENRLPGWSAGDEPATRDVRFHLDLPNNALCDGLWKKGDPSVYHYELARASKSSPWVLQKAWRTDENGKTVQEYQMPTKMP